MLRQHLLEVSARMSGGMLCNLFWGSRHHDLAALIAPFRAEIDDPVGVADHIVCRVVAGTSGRQGITPLRLRLKTIEGR